MIAFPFEFIFTYNISLMWRETINIYTTVNKKKIKRSKEYVIRRALDFDQ